MSLYVVYTPATGHVVGAVRAIGGTPPAGVAALVGDVLPVRVTVGDETVTLSLPATHLAVHGADDEPGVFTDPMAFGVDEVAGADPKPALVPLTRGPLELTLTTTDLIVRVPTADTTRPTPVLALVSGGQDTHPVSREMGVGEDTVELPISVTAGAHGVLVLVAGWVGHLTVEETRS